MQERAVFISRTTAMLAAINAARRLNVPDETIQSRLRVFPVHKRGEMKGYEAWYPASSQHNQPVME